MRETAIIAPVWSFCGLGAASRPEDLDDALEKLLDAWGDTACDPQAPRRLASLFGLGVEEMARRIGVDLCPEVATARLILIDAAFAECRVRLRQGGWALRQALTVCAALQFEALGDAAAGAAVFAALAGGEVEVARLARILRSSLPLGGCVALAVTRALALAGCDACGTRESGFSDGWAQAAE